MKPVPQKVVIVGAGKVASQIGNWLHRGGVEIIQLINRELEKAQSLAEEWSAQLTDDFNALHPDAEMVIIAVSDDAIGAVSDQLPKSDAVVVHTSGSRPLEDLQKHQRRGVFYPLQTFSAHAVVDFSRVPICVEGSDDQVEDALLNAVELWGAQPFRLNSEQRGSLHVAAVVANNFTNHLWGLSRDLLVKNDIAPEIVHPLMEATLQKALTNHPHDIQTGPAVRGDEETIRRHLEKLSGDATLHRIYELLTSSIIEKNRNAKL